MKFSADDPHILHTAAVLIASWLTAGCTPAQFTTVTIFDTPSAFVRLEADRTIQNGRKHSHPATIPTEQLAGILSGIIVEEPLTRLPLYDDLSRPRNHRAFSEKEADFFAPLLSIALNQATPEEVVTFYQSRDISGTRREVTSGGLFVEGEELHIILANYRSKTHTSVDVGVADTLDDRLTPMQSLAPQRGRLDFEPLSAKRAQPAEGFATLLRWDRRELIVLFEQVSPRSTIPSPAASSR